jgi:hypothetical protein
MDSRFRGNDRNPAYRLVSSPQRRESVHSPQEQRRSTPNTYAANPQKVKPFIWGERQDAVFIFHEGGPAKKKAGACDSGLQGVRYENPD